MKIFFMRMQKNDVISDFLDYICLLVCHKRICSN